MTKETERHVMTRTMELKKQNKLVCYPKLSQADFYGSANHISSIFLDLKFDQERIKECNCRDLKEENKNA